MTEAHLRVRDAFELRSRGAVLAADVLDGTAGVGMALDVPGLAGPLLVAAVEVVDWRVGTGGDASLALVFRDPPALATLRAACPPGTVVRLHAASAPARGRPGGLRRFWFPVAGQFGIGVTAATEAEATTLAEAVHARYHPDAALGAVVPDIDVSTLDPGHVQPNAGPSAVRGVWFPFLNG